MANDPVGEKSNPIPSGGVVLADLPVPAPSMPAGAMPIVAPVSAVIPSVPTIAETKPDSLVNPAMPPPVSDTVIIPSPTGASGAFIPQGAGDPGIVPPAANNGGGLRRFLPVFIIILILLLLGFGGFVAFSLINKNKVVTITYWGLWENETTMRPLITEFESKNPTIKVQYVKQNQRQYRERLQEAIRRGDGPDVFRFHNTWVAMLQNELNPVPVNVMTPAQFAGTFYPVAARDLVVGQTIMGLPYSFDGLGLYYNEDLFAAAGVNPPTTYEELLGVVPRLTVKNGADIITSGIALGTAGNIEHFSDILATMLFQNGAKLLDPTGIEAEQTMTFYRKFADPNDPAYTWNDTLDNSVSAFANGRVAMIFAPSWRAFDIKQLNPNLRFRVAPIPQLPGNTVTWASYWVEGVSAKSKLLPQAWKFVQYLTSKDAAVKLYTEAAKSRLFGPPYARVDLGQTLASDAYLGAFIQQAQTARSFPLSARTYDNGLNDKLIKYLEDGVNSINKGSSPTEALQTVSAGFKQVLGSYGLVSRSAASGQ